jgi:excisionase family DNA binding protein
VRKIKKIRSEAESYSASEAAGILGVSIPTLKRMVAEDRLESFRTPGGHLRILAASLEAVREPRAERIRPIREASAVLQNRRERVEELTLEAQEVRAMRELARLQREDQEETEREQAEEEARELEAAERQAELELEREQLEQEHAQERARKESERTIAAFRCRWLEEGRQALAVPECRWLSAAQRKEIIDALDAEIKAREPQDTPRMATILAHTIAALIERYDAQRLIQQQRQRVIEGALSKLSFCARDQEKARASVAAREALRRLDADATEIEMQTSADEAVQPIQHAAERRLLRERVLRWATQQLPWNRTELDAVRVRRECAEIQAELPEDASEAECKEALEPTVREACQEIEERQASKQRQAQKTQLIEQGIAEVSTCLLDLRRAGELTTEEYLDSEFTDHIKTAVRRTLRKELSGNESSKEIRALVRQAIEEEL